MAEPLDSITAIHNAFRRDMLNIDAAALGKAKGKPGFEAMLGRFRFLKEVLEWHALGEELGIFPLLDGIAPMVSATYEKEHRGLDEAADFLINALSEGDPLEIARTSAVLKFLLDFHLAKEDTLLYPLIRERVPMPEQGKGVGIVAAAVPQERFPELVNWLYPLLGDDDRENMARIMQSVMPPPAFASTRQLIEKAVGQKGWAELTRRIPSLS